MEACPLDPPIYDRDQISSWILTLANTYIYNVSLSKAIPVEAFGRILQIVAAAIHRRHSLSKLSGTPPFVRSLTIIFEKVEQAFPFLQIPGYAHCGPSGILRVATLLDGIPLDVSSREESRQDCG